MSEQIEIERRFEENVRGKPIDLSNYKDKHCGKEGHWLEERMGVSHNSRNEPDLLGYEMKHDKQTKITLGDFSASEYAYTKKRPTLNKLNDWTNETMTRSTFIQCFGNPNPEKNGRYSWSGRCVPTYDTWNSNGQIMWFNEENDLLVHYSYEKDRRHRKEEFPAFLKKDLVIAIWKRDKLKHHIEKKFNQRGFFLCQKKGDTYDRIRFGRPFDYAHFIECIKNKSIIFDSGMYEGNTRNYSMFRGTNFWKELLI